ncbi:hypothetical protein WA158_005336 [Blastocystis sp. Blastoise]
MSFSDLFADSKSSQKSPVKKTYGKSTLSYSPSKPLTTDDKTNEISTDTIKPIKRTSKITSYFNVVSISLSNQNSKKMKIEDDENDQENLTEQNKDDKIQAILDIGQQSIRPTLCPICGMLYYKYEKDDTKNHDTFCSMFSEGIPIPPLKDPSITTIVEDTMKNTQIIGIPGDIPFPVIPDLTTVLNREMNYKYSSKQPKYHYLFVLNKKIVGYLRVSYTNSNNNNVSDSNSNDLNNINNSNNNINNINNSNNNINNINKNNNNINNSNNNINNSNNNINNSNNMNYHSNTLNSQKVETDLLWVLKSKQGNKIATQLINTAQKHLHLPYHLHY